MEKYAVYSHSFSGMVFYVGSGIYDRDNISKSRAFNFSSRSKDWKKFCEGNTEKIEVKILFESNDRRLAYDKEEEITRYYMEQGSPLVNVNIGTKKSEEWIKKYYSGENHPLWGKNHSDETRNKMSLAHKGKINHMYGKKHTKESRNKISLAHKGKVFSEEHRKNIGKANIGKTPVNARKVLVINHENGEEKIFNSIAKAHKFILEKGHKRSRSFFYNNINKGIYNFENYTLELDKSKDQ